MSESGDDLGGSPTLPLLLVGRGPVIERFASVGDAGLADAVSGTTGGAVTLQVTTRDVAADRTLLGSFGELAAEAGEHPVTVLALEGDLPDRWPSDFDEVKATLTDGVRALKAAGTRVVALGVSTIDPSGPSPASTHAERTAHELSLALLELSVNEGISVLDTDRIVAEVGGREHVTAFLHFDDSVQRLLVEAMVGILSDYGFFEARPLVPQIGVDNR